MTHPRFILSDRQPRPLALEGFACQGGKTVLETTIPRQFLSNNCHEKTDLLFLGLAFFTFPNPSPSIPT